jgi:shikimate dehydrogenase
LAPEANSLVFLNRTLERAEAAASKFANASALSWDRLPEAFEAADLIVQTTTLGMHGADAAPAWPVHVCKGGTLVADIVYRPLETELLRVARARGLATLDGLGMLIHQAARAFYFWFGIHPDTGLARARAMRALQQ